MGSTHEPKKDPQWGGRSSGRGLNRNSIGMHIFFPVGVYITRQACNRNKPSEASTTQVHNRDVVIWNSKSSRWHCDVCTVYNVDTQ